MAYNSEKFDRMLELIKGLYGLEKASYMDDENPVFSIPSWNFYAGGDYIAVDPYCMYSMYTSRVYKNFHGFDYPEDIIQLKLILNNPIIN